MDENLFVMTADVNGKPIPLWQERLEQLYTAGAPFGELLSLVRWLIDDRAIERILGMSEEELFAGIDDPEAHAAEMRAQFDGVARLVHERDALREALKAAWPLIAARGNQHGGDLATRARAALADDAGSALLSELAAALKDAIQLLSRWTDGSRAVLLDRESELSRFNELAPRARAALAAYDAPHQEE